MQPPILIRIPSTLLDPGTPGVVKDPATATQADAAYAYVETYSAWEGCAVNLAALGSLINDSGSPKKR